MIWIGLVLCTSILIAQIIDDAFGDKNKVTDVKRLTVAAVIQSLLMWWLMKFYPWRSLSMMFGFHFMFFDYIIAYVLYKNTITESEEAKHWFSYLGSNPIDMLWKHWHPGWRLASRVAVFLIALTIYFLL
jgi:hypothetical protein